MTTESSRRLVPSITIFSPLLRKLPFFYGWLIVAIAMLAAFLGAGLNNISMGVVLKPVSDDLGWSRTVTAAPLAVGSILAGALAPFFGYLVDRLGPRILLPAGAAAVGLLVIFVSFVSQPWQFYAAYIPARALAETLLVGIVPITAVANWFYRMRPRAMGLVVMSVPMGSSALSLLYQYLILRGGWRRPFWILGIALWAGVVMPGVFFLRRQPEDLGMAPDGAAPAATVRQRGSGEGRGEQIVGEYSWELRDAVRTQTFWLIIVANTLAVIATGGIAFNLVAYCTDVGIDSTIAATALSIFALCGAFGNVLWGTIAERVNIRGLNTLTLFLAAAAVTMLLYVRSPLSAYGFAIFFGLTGRGAAVLSHILVAHYFGRRSFGAISGFAEPFTKAGLGLGPFFTAAAFDLTGSYQGIFMVFVGTFILSAFLIFLARPPIRIAR